MHFNNMSMIVEPTVLQVSPVIHPGSEAHVHHLLIYECNGLNNTHVGYSDHCDSEGEIGITVAQCREGVLVTGWAVGGEVSMINIMSTFNLAELSITIPRSLCTLLMWLIPLVDLVPPATWSWRFTMTTPVNFQVKYKKY